MRRLTAALSYVCFLAMGLVVSLAPISVSAQDITEAEALRNYEAAEAAGNHAAATKFILDYMEQTEGENAPLTVSLTQRYGNQLREEGDISEAVSVLTDARERAIVAYGEYGIEMFEVNLDLGEAYVDRNIGLGKPKKYFDDALEVLRQNDQRETMLYVKTLVGVASRLAQAGALGGALATDTFGFTAGDLVQSARQRSGRNETGPGFANISYGYASGYRVLEEYLQEAIELTEVLEIEDPYLSAKIAIVQAKIKVLENVFLEVVPPSIKGSVSGTTAQENYDREDGNLLAAIDVLMEDAELNQGFVDIANNARLEIAWLGEDMQKMNDFCSSNTLNMASSYPPDRLFPITPDGDVIAPRFSFRITTNIFDRPNAGKYSNRNLNEDDRPQPQFVPVCINGRLMAALINTPVVSIEDLD